MKKQALITLEYAPSIGGVATYYKNIIEQFPSDSIIVIAPENTVSGFFDQQQKYTIIRSKILAQLQHNHKKFPGLKKVNSIKLHAQLLKELAVIIDRHHIEHLHVGNILPLGTVVSAVAKQKKCTYSIFTHGYDVLVPQAYATKKTLLLKILNSAQTIISNSTFTKKEVVKLGIPHTKINVLYPTIPTHTTTSHETIDSIKEKLVQKYKLHGKKIILSVGRLVERKGFDQVLRALPRILYSIPNTHYVLVGNGPCKQNLEKLAKQKKATQHVIFTNAASETELEAWYGLCDVFAMPSRQIGPDVEGFGIVYLEANKAGKPVIGGQSGGVPEAILDEETGILVDPTDTAALTAACVRLLSDTQYASRLGTQGMQRVMEQFSNDNLHDKIKHIFF